MINKIRMDPFSIDVPEFIIAGRLGFGGEKRIPDEFTNLFTLSFDRIRENSRPTAITEYLPVFQDNRRTILDDMDISSDTTRKHLSDIDGGTIILATLGNGVDDIIRKEEEQGNTLSSFFLDGIASEFVEFFLRKVDQRLREDQKSKNGTVRISPGYGDLPLSLNDWVVKRLNGEEEGITVVEGSYQFIPRKTISAIIGWRDIDNR